MATQCLACGRCEIPLNRRGAEDPRRLANSAKGLGGLLSALMPGLTVKRETSLDPFCQIHPARLTVSPGINTSRRSGGAPCGRQKPVPSLLCDSAVRLLGCANIRAPTRSHSLLPQLLPVSESRLPDGCHSAGARSRDQDIRRAAAVGW